MPVVNVRWNNKISSNEKTELKESLVDIINEAISVDKTKIYVFLNDYDVSDVSNVDCPVVQINWVANPLRNAEAKALLIKKITDRMGEFPGVRKDNCLVIITEAQPDSSGIGGTTSAAATQKK